jgi:hypothetical protein
MGLCVPVDAIMATLPYVRGSLDTPAQGSIDRFHSFLSFFEPGTTYKTALRKWLSHFGDEFLSGNGYRHCATCGVVRKGGKEVFYAGANIPADVEVDYGFMITSSLTCERDIDKIIEDRRRRGKLTRGLEDFRAWEALDDVPYAEPLAAVS